MSLITGQKLLMFNAKNDDEQFVLIENLVICDSIEYL